MARPRNAMLPGYRLPFTLELHPRSDWGAREPRYKEPMQIPIKFMCITYREPLRPLDSEEEMLREMQEYDMDRLGMPDIESNFFIGKNGVVYEGRGWFASPSLGEKYTPKMKEHIGKYFQVTYFADYETNPENNLLLIAGSEMIKVGLDKHLISHAMGFIEVKIQKGDKVTFQSLYN